ncbi:hypothetical protein BK145_10580 [Paenibacillus peoriae]|uniref:Uncharacterized protein n=1 Tax=Paenibacillus polymyxa TaxID=1406 RepID=A0ABX2ZGM7_PAEPO|nr:hypothetical protein A7312_01050 [Paenibacillus polymyxa]OME73930.1 hypothetical protein BK119_05460 [Paenibacillus peoriae]OMF80724.1 hypothetical protein BK145_10580 [Paenibacillus peoriae]
MLPKRAFLRKAFKATASLVQHYSVYSIFMFILSLVFLYLQIMRQNGSIPVWRFFISFKKRHLPSCVPPSGKQVQYQNEETEKFDTGIAICS